MTPAAGGAFTGEGFLDFVGLGAGGLEVLLHLGFQVLARVPKIACMPSPTTTTPAAPSALSLSGLALVTSASFTRRRVMQASRLTMFAASAERADELQRELIAAARRALPSPLRLRPRVPA